MNTELTRRTLLSLAGAATMETAALAAARAEGGLSPARAPTFATQTPMHIGMVTLVVRDLERMSDFYRDVIGLAVQDRSETSARLGAGGVPLLLLIAAPTAEDASRRSAGLFHTAFLMPTRKDLARWLVHVARNRVPLTGFADHFVSEAIYLDDPEGNGIEVYSDRPADTWTWQSGTLRMGTEHLDVDDLVALTNPQVSDYAGAPDGLRVGHIHLRVGDLAQADAFYRGGIGMDLTVGVRGAHFLSSGGYHHHLGLNVWQSAGAPKRADGTTGLRWFSIAVKQADLATAEERVTLAGARVTGFAGGFETADPWGTQVRIVGI